MTTTQRPTGTMTAAMTALPTRHPKLLRVALVRGGKIVDERTFAEGDEVSIGTSERCHFILNEPGVPAHHVLFSARGGRQLHAPPGASALVADGGPARPVHDRTQLGDGARGKVSFGASTLLFQSVAAPPLPARLRLPGAMTRGGGLDWPVTVIAAFSFLAHFGVIGSLYSDWNDRIVPDQESLVSLTTRLHSVPPTPVDTLAEPDSTTPAPAPAPTSPDRTRSNDRSRSTTARSEPGPSNASMIKSAEAQFIQTIAALNPAGGPATRSVIDPSGALPDLSAMAGQDLRVARGGDPLALRMNPAGGPVGPGERVGLGDGLRRAGDGPGALAAPTPVAPTPTAPTAPGPTPVGPAPDDLQRVLAFARVKARACYNAGLGSHPDMEGRVSFSLSLNGAGNVTSVSASPSGSLTPDVVGCIRGALSGLSFTGKGQPSTVSGSFNLVNANKQR